MKAGGSDEVRGRWMDALSARITLVVMGILLTFSATLGGAVYVITANGSPAPPGTAWRLWLRPARRPIEVQVARHMDAPLAVFAGPDLVAQVRALSQGKGEPSETARTALAAELRRNLRTSELLESALVLGPAGQIRFAPSISIGR